MGVFDLSSSPVEPNEDPPTDRERLCMGSGGSPFPRREDDEEADLCIGTCAEGAPYILGVVLRGMTGVAEGRGCVLADTGVIGPMG